MAEAIFHENDTHAVLIDLDTRTVLLELKVRGGRIALLDDTFRSWSSLSECLRDYADMTFAVEALTANDVPHDHPLWTLGFKGGETYWRRALKR